MSYIQSSVRASSGAETIHRQTCSSGDVPEEDLWTFMKVQQQLQKLKNDVFRFQEQLMDVKPSPDVIDRLRETMTDIEISISAFKDTQHQSFEELLKDERGVWLEICTFQRKMDSWSLCVRAEACPRRSEKPCDWRSLPEEVTALQTFLQQTGGRDGGWDQFDHRSFLKVWTKHRGKPSYRPEARLYLPGKTEEEVKRHEEWFLELRRLQDDKREAICRWRAWKRREQELQREQRDEDEEPQEEDEEQRRETSERLEVWRRHRTQQREQERQQQLRDQIQHTRRAKEERRRQLELKLLVETHLQQKKQQEEQRRLEEEAQEQEETQERRRQAAEGIRRFQQRDSRRLEEQLQEKQSKEQERKRTLEKLKEKVAVHIDRDPSRLWRLTKAWQERSKEIGPSGTGPVLQIFHRAVPAWRQDS